MNDSLELFSARVCPYAHRSRLVLMEKGIDFVLTEINLNDKPERFLKISAYGKVPALVHNDVEIYESAIINEYLDEVFPEPALLPAAPARRAAVRIWIDYCNNRFVDDLYALIKNQEPGSKARLESIVHDHFIFMEKRGLAMLSGLGPYWLGNEPSLIDFAVYPHFERLPAWEHYRGIKIPSECQRLWKWIEAMRERDSIKAIANAPEYYVERYQSYATG